MGVGYGVWGRVESQSNGQKGRYEGISGRFVHLCGRKDVSLWF